MSARYSLSRTFAAILLSFALLGCGRKLSGTYETNPGSFLSMKMTFTSSNKVEMTNPAGTTEVTYEIDGDKVKIGSAGQTLVFTIDDKGCLDSGGIMGKFCKK